MSWDTEKRLKGWLCRILRIWDVAVGFNSYDPCLWIIGADDCEFRFTVWYHNRSEVIKTVDTLETSKELCIYFSCDGKIKVN